jgi:hypothetical protein
MRLLFNGYITDSVAGETDIPNAYTIKVNIEANGLSVPIYFESGNRTGTVNPGVAEYSSDIITPSMFGLTVFPANMQYWVRHEVAVVAGGKFPYARTPNYTNLITGETFWIGGAAAVDQLTPTGDMTAASGWTQNSHLFLPMCMIGRPTKKMMAWVVIGASIEYGAGDNAGDGGNDGGGHIRRALFDLNGKKIARMTLAIGGESAKGFLTTCAKRRQVIKYGTHAISGHGGNDYTNGETLANTLTRLASVWALIKSEGVPYVEQMALSPKTYTSNGVTGFDTLVDQTVRPGFETGGAWRDAGNSAMAAAVPTDPNLDGFVDLTAAQVDSVEIAKWKAPPRSTIDGTHPEAWVHIDMATLNKPHYESLRASYEGT